MRGRLSVKFILFVCITMFVSSITPSFSFAKKEEKFVMSYVYFGAKNKYVDYVNRTNNSLHEVSPNYFNLNSKGGLQITKTVDVNFINEMHNRGIKVVPFLSNHWEREKASKALKNRKKLADEIANFILKNNLDGINIDIENISEASKNDFTDFVRLIREKLPLATIAVAVPPKPAKSNAGYYRAFDYKRLGNYVDYLMIMAYDEHYKGSGCGPVASASYVEYSIKYALENVPKEKIVLGIPFYGRYWKNGDVNGGNAITMASAESVIRKYRGKVVFDKTSMSPKAVVTVPTDDTSALLSTKGEYTIWYENEKSIKYKLSLVPKYGIKGVGSWSLGQEPKSIWSYYTKYLNNDNSKAVALNQ